MGGVAEQVGVPRRERRLRMRKIGIPARTRSWIRDPFIDDLWIRLVPFELARLALM